MRPGDADRPPDQTTAPDPQSLLEALIWTLPLPTTPRRLDRSHASMGLALLDLGIGLPHIVRATESLRYLDRNYLERSIVLDLDLTSIPPDHLATLEAKRSAAAGAQSIWLPLVPRPGYDESPAVVTDTTGKTFPRMTSIEGRELLAAGIVSVLRMLVEGHEDTHRPDSKLASAFSSNQRSRWLLESAVSHLVTQSSPGAPALILATSAALLQSPRSQMLDEPGQHESDSDSYRIRSTAQSALRSLLIDSTSPNRHAFLELCQTAATSDFVITRLPLETPPHRLLMTPQRVPAESRRTGAAGWFHGWRPQAGVHHCNVRLRFPKALKSFHVNLEVDDDLLISRFTLKTDADSHLSARFSDNAAALAEPAEMSALSRLEELRTQEHGPQFKLLEFELQALAREMGDLVEKRANDLSKYIDYLKRVHDRFGLVYLPPRADPQLNPFARPPTLFSLISLLGEFRAGGYTRLATEDRITPKFLDTVVKAVEDLQLRADISCDNEPSDNLAHAKWLGNGDANARGWVNADVDFVLIDEAPALVEANRRFLVASALLLAGVATLMFGDGWIVGPISWIANPALSHLWDGPELATSVSRDAIATVLLLIPGLLITRIGIPPKGSVLRDMRTYQFRSAFLSIGAAAVCASVVAAARSAHLVQSILFIGVIVAMVALGMNLLEGANRFGRRMQVVPPQAGLPSWLRGALSDPGQARPDSTFDLRV